MGVDFTMATSTFLGTRNLSVAASGSTPTAHVRCDTTTRLAGPVELPDDPVVASFLFREIQENYRADVGFTPRTGLPPHRGQPSASAAAETIRSSAAWPSAAT